MKQSSKSYAVGPYTVRKDAGASRMWRVFVGTSRGSVSIFSARSQAEAVAFAQQMMLTARTQPTLIPANGGTEQPFTTSFGVRVLYVYDIENGTHRYLNLDTDTLLPREWSPLTGMALSSEEI